MDLRIVKTKREIKQAFLDLRDKWIMPEKIKVKDICDLAHINKATFYKHYADSLELANEIEKQALDNLLEAFSEKNLLFQNRHAYIYGLYAAIEKQYSNLKRIFRGKVDVLCTKLEDKLTAIYNDIDKTSEEGMRLAFAIGGFVRILREHLFSEDYNATVLAESTAKLINTVMT